MVKHIAAACLTAMLLSAELSGAQVSSQTVQTEDVQYRSGELTLAALLMVPRTERPVPAAVVIQGSGSSDRANPWARDIAEAFLRNGIAVLLTDKRGSGGSGGDWRVAGFAELAVDALAGVDFLRTRPEIHRQRIGLVGLSQGGWVAPLAAARSDQVAFVVNVSGAAVGFAEQTALEMVNTARNAGLSEPLVQEVILLNAATAKYVTTGDWDQYARARARVLETGAREIAARFPALEGAQIWTFFRNVAAYDPMPFWIQVAQPVLVVYGEEDERDNVPVAESVRRLEHAFRAVNKRNHRIVVVPGAGHDIRNPQTRRLAAPFVDTLAAWLHEHFSR